MPQAWKTGPQGRWGVEDGWLGWNWSGEPGGGVRMQVGRAAGGLQLRKVPERADAKHSPFMSKEVMRPVPCSARSRSADPEGRIRSANHRSIGRRDLCQMRGGLCQSGRPSPPASNRISVVCGPRMTSGRTRRGTLPIALRSACLPRFWALLHCLSHELRRLRRRVVAVVETTRVPPSRNPRALASQAATVEWRLPPHRTVNLSLSRPNQHPPWPSK